MEEETIESPESLVPEDRFSLLPDALIHHILSFVADMRITVQMSILSNRWRHIWKSLQVLAFEYAADKGIYGLKDFVTRTLMLRDDIDVRRLSVLWIDYLDMDANVAETVNTWVLYAVRRKVKELVFCFGFNGIPSFDFEFPECVFNSETLTELTLYNSNLDPVQLFLPESIYLPKLKYVKLQDLLLNEDSMNEFFASCPALESIIMRNCRMHNKLKIISKTLKHFEITFSSFDETVSEAATGVMLYAPNLESFTSKCNGSQLYGLHVVSLVKANVEMIVQEKRDDLFTYSEVPGGSKDMYAMAMMVMLEKFHNVKDLTLSSRVIQIISRSPDLLKTEPPQMVNLRCMKLHSFLSKGCGQAILYLLRISPSIEFLTVCVCKDCFDEQPTELYCQKTNFASETLEDYWKPGLTSPCTLLHLKSVKLIDVDGSITELRFIEVLLKYAVKLEKVFLYWNWDGPGNNMERVMKFNEKLHSLPRASSRVSTLFY